MNFLKCTCADSWADEAKLILRVVLGVIFLYHGYAKFGMGTEAIAGFFGAVGIPMAGFFAPLVIWVEMIGGVALILGVLTHWVSKLFVIISLVALFMVHIKNGFSIAQNGYEFILLILAASVTTMIMGAGKYSVDAMIGKSENTTNA